jgi:hypothetical protein
LATPRIEKIRLSARVRTWDFKVDGLAQRRQPVALHTFNDYMTEHTRALGLVCLTTRTTLSAGE